MGKQKKGSTMLSKVEAMDASPTEAMDESPTKANALVSSGNCAYDLLNERTTNLMAAAILGSSSDAEASLKKSVFVLIKGNSAYLCLLCPELVRLLKEQKLELVGVPSSSNFIEISGNASSSGDDSLKSDAHFSGMNEVEDDEEDQHMDEDEGQFNGDEIDVGAAAPPPPPVLPIGNQVVPIFVKVNGVIVEQVAVILRSICEAAEYLGGVTPRVFEVLDGVANPIIPHNYVVDYEVQLDPEHVDERFYQLPQTYAETVDALTRIVVFEPEEDLVAEPEED